jgi:hypothetical protein
VKIDRNVIDPSATTVRQLRPDYLIWMKNVLVLKGEEKADDIRQAVDELTQKNECWNLSVYCKVPYVLCYAAGGNMLQFFATRAQEITPISPCYNLSNPTSELKVISMYRMLLLCIL